jgi:hypothetical protein
MTRSKERLTFARIAIYLFFMVLPTAGGAAALPLLWRVEGPPTSYLFGTVHSSDQRAVAVLSPAFNALDTCRSFHPEVDLSPDIAERTVVRFLNPATPRFKITRLPASLR